MNMKIKSYILTFTLFLCGCVVTANAQNNMTVTDCQGHTYPVVKIGDQYWMAENLQCTKYDTQSERAGATLSTSKESTYAPYYTDASDRSNWKSTKYSGNLSDEQVKKLGYLYNWAAAVGLATGEEAESQTSAFSGNRQGICPNGWHIPTKAEWDALDLAAIGGKKDESGDFPIVKTLKTASGWYMHGNGTDDYSFAVLPAGGALGSTVYHVGYFARFWAAAPDNSTYAYYRDLDYDNTNDYLLIEDYTYDRKYGALSVRCVRNNNEQQAQHERKTVTNTVTDCQGHTYPVVKIGNQYWMAENLQCTKYDTQSERAGATLSTSNSSTYAPYYTDGRNATENASGNLTSSHRRKLGLLYNWAATVGLTTESEAKNRTTAFSGRRQGICPNGWHVPTSAEWNTLRIYIGSNAGKRLKATSGWYENGNGTDDYSFATLPAGNSNGSTVFLVGYSAFFWTATPYNNGDTYLFYIFSDDDKLDSGSSNKDNARSVRCIRN